MIEQHPLEMKAHTHTLVHKLFSSYNSTGYYSNSNDSMIETAVTETEADIHTAKTP